MFNLSNLACDDVCPSKSRRRRHSLDGDYRWAAIGRDAFVRFAVRTLVAAVVDEIVVVVALRAIGDTLAHLKRAYPRSAHEYQRQQNKESQGLLQDFLPVSDIDISIELEANLLELGNLAETE